MTRDTDPGLLKISPQVSGATEAYHYGKYPRSR